MVYEIQRLMGGEKNHIKFLSHSRKIRQNITEAEHLETEQLESLFRSLASQLLTAAYLLLLCRSGVSQLHF